MNDSNIANCHTFRNISPNSCTPMLHGIRIKSYFFFKIYRVFHHILKLGHAWILSDKRFIRKDDERATLLEWQLVPRGCAPPHIISFSTLYFVTHMIHLPISGISNPPNLNSFSFLLSVKNNFGVLLCGLWLNNIFQNDCLATQCWCFFNWKSLWLLMGKLPWFQKPSKGEPCIK